MTSCMCPSKSGVSGVHVDTSSHCQSRQTLISHDETVSNVDLSKVEGWKRKCKPNVENFDDRLKRYCNDLTPTREQCVKMFDAFIDELQLGMKLHRDVGPSFDPKQCSFKMLDSFIKTIPSGNETGTFYAIDFGGTNFRAVRIELKGKSVLDVSQSKCSLLEDRKHFPKGLMDKDASATDLFDFFAKTMKQFMKESGDLDKAAKYFVGFTFSFPCKLRQIDSAMLLEWTKDFETGRNTDDKVEGQDVSLLLQSAFDRHDVPARVCAVMNDTVGTLLSCAYEMDHKKYPQARVGVILGTGMNACYYDDECKFHKYEGNIINIECGNFNRGLPRCSVDMELDFASANRGAQLLEKMVSGAYLGELCRRTLVKVFQGRTPSKSWMPHSLTSEMASKIASDETPDLVVTSDIVRSIWQDEMKTSDAAALKSICKAVFERSAALAAVFIAACAQKTGYMQAAMGGVAVAVDGSLYKCNHFYRFFLRQSIASLVGADRAKLIHLVCADDGSGKGAGIVASQLVGN